MNLSVNSETETKTVYFPTQCVCVCVCLYFELTIGTTTYEYIPTMDMNTNLYWSNVKKNETSE